MKSANEELVTVNEEAQSTNEELEAFKEELQSLNEELNTINLELSDKVADLDRANSDLENLFEKHTDRDRVLRPCAGHRKTLRPLHPTSLASLHLILAFR